MSVNGKKMMQHKERLMIKQKGRCYYCNGHVVNDPVKNAYCINNKIRFPDNAATVEHIYPKGDIRRLLLTPWQEIVVACYRCNQLKNEQFRNKEGEDYVNLINILNTGRIITCRLPGYRDFKRFFGETKDYKNWLSEFA